MIINLDLFFVLNRGRRVDLLLVFYLMDLTGLHSRRFFVCDLMSVLSWVSRLLSHLMLVLVVDMFVVVSVAVVIMMIVVVVMVVPVIVMVIVRMGILYRLFLLLFKSSLLLSLIFQSELLRLLGKPIALFLFESGALGLGRQSRLFSLLLLPQFFSGKFGLKTLPLGLRLIGKSLAFCLCLNP